MTDNTLDIIKSRTHYEKRIGHCSKKILQVLKKQPHLEKFVNDYNVKNPLLGFSLCRENEIFEIKNAMPNECKCMFITRACLNTNFRNKPSKKDVNSTIEHDYIPPYIPP